MLVPIFGENGAIIVQYAITLAVVVVLIVLVVWGIRHFGGGSTGPAVRGRLPRLAIIDTLPVDNKRKLVLLRRDNVEHLVLIGGPSDVVVEPSIVRQRVAQRSGQATATRPATAAAAAAAAMAAGPVAPPVEEVPDPAPVESTPVRVATPEAEPAEGAIAFARRRTNTGSVEHAAPERVARAYAPSRRPPARATHAALTESARETPRARHAHAVQAAAEPETMQETVETYRVAPRAAATRHEPAPSRFAPVPDEVSAPPNGPVPGYESITDEPNHDAVSAFAPRAYDEDQGTGFEPSESGGESHEIEVSPAPPTAEAEPPDGDGQTDEVNELEEEMARLLGQISTTRREQE